MIYDLVLVGVVFGGGVYNINLLNVFLYIKGGIIGIIFLNM